MPATRDRPMINIAKVSDWLTRNANERLYPRLLYVHHQHTLAYCTYTQAQKLTVEA